MDYLSKFKKVNGNTLKVVACISMLIDHFAAGFMLPYVRYGFYNGSLTIDQLNTIYRTFRYIGRTAFPVYCFLLVEGFLHTKSRLRYALSLLLFGIVSEVPFDLLFFSEESVFELNMITALKANEYLIWDQCNVYFTLLLGLLSIWLIDVVTKKLREEIYPQFVYYLPAIICTTIAAFAAYKINSDYDFYGVILISIFYLLYKYDYIRILAAFLFISQLSTEFYSFPGFILMLLYSRKRGRNLGYFKYFFYLFYPLHLTAIYIARCLAVR